GGEVKAFYMTQGNHDLVLIADMPNDEKLANFVLRLGAAGNVRTTTLRAYSEDEYRKIVAGLS
ncbi:MAG: GYD domain-containing protein, partial [Nitrospiraceae bacterium]